MTNKKQKCIIMTTIFILVLPELTHSLKKCSMPMFLMQFDMDTVTNFFKSYETRNGFLRPIFAGVTNRAKLERRLRLFYLAKPCTVLSDYNAFYRYIVRLNGEFPAVECDIVER